MMNQMNNSNMNQDMNNPMLNQMSNSNMNQDEKVSEIIQKYRAKSNDRDDTKKFIYNAKQLNQDLTVAEAGIMNNSNIFVVATKGIKEAK